MLTRVGIAFVCASATVLVGLAGPSSPARAHDDGTHVPAGFSDRLAIGNLSEPVTVAFAPDGTAFVGLKTGVIKTFDYNASTREFEPFASSNNVADLDVSVHNYWDRGLTGIAVDPKFGQAGHNYLYVNYTYNRDPRDPGPNPPVPKWGTTEGQYDGCDVEAAMPSPAAPSGVAGCIVTTRVSRLELTKTGVGWVMSGGEQPLLEAACLQFQSHASGDVAIGPDGYLYASAGDGSSFDTADYGQAANGCEDPAGEGGSLRAQDVRSGADPLGLGGSVYRVNAATGAAPDGSSDNAERLVAYGQRNPWRLAFRPGTKELFTADVGSSQYEEINRIDMAGFADPVNFGWPCFEGVRGGAAKNPLWDVLDNPVCEDLYDDQASNPSTVRAPTFAYATRGAVLTQGEECESTTGSISGVAFAGSASSYPAAYRGALFFSDFARRCVWRLGKKADGSPDPTKVYPVIQGANSPVDLVTGPDGDIFYVDYGLDESGVPRPQAGAVRRITYDDPRPVAAIEVDATYGPLSRTYTFSAADTVDPKGRELTYTWDLDGNGSFETSTGKKSTATKKYDSASNVLVSVRAKNAKGKVGTAYLTVYAGDSPPVISVTEPTPVPKWRVGQSIDFSATATDANETLTPGNFVWSLVMRHCPGICHSHPIGGWPYTTSGSLVAPDHEFPSHMLLTVAVTDSRGLRITKTVRLDPLTSAYRMGTEPEGLRLNVGEERSPAPFVHKAVRGSQRVVSAAQRQRRDGVTYEFVKWSDGGARTHIVFADAAKKPLIARYRAIAASVKVETGPPGLSVKVDGKQRKRFSARLDKGTRIRVSAPPVQIRNGVRWVFVGWSDGGARSHNVKVRGKRILLVAEYRRS